MGSKMKHLFFIACLFICWPGGAKAQGRLFHYIETSHSFGEKVYSTLSYTQRIKKWGLQAGIATIWQPLEVEHMPGITTQISRFFDLSDRYYLRGGIIGGNLKNCWEVGANVRAGAQGDRVGVARIL